MQNINENVKAVQNKVAAIIHPNHLIYEFFGIAFQVYAYAYWNPLYRGFAYFIGWLLAYHITGAEFNPATTVGRFFGVKDYNNWKSILLTILI
jgi:glycerol uptake facilitator-like aquaporin